METVWQRIVQLGDRKLLKALAVQHHERRAAVREGHRGQHSTVVLDAGPWAGNETRLAGQAAARQTCGQTDLSALGMDLPLANAPVPIDSVPAVDSRSRPSL